MAGRGPKPSDIQKRAAEKRAREASAAGSSECAQPDPPAGVGAAGLRLWADVCGGVADDWELDAKDLALLEIAARTADTVAELEAQVAQDGTIVKGSQGQDRLHQAVPALTAARALQARVVAQIELVAPAPKTGHLSGRQRDKVRLAQMRGAA
jgi:hypothetical protein